jgi:hypothetical protein
MVPPTLDHVLDMGDYIEANITIADEVTLGALEEKEGEAVAVIGFVGAGPGVTMSNTVVLRNPRFQVLVRHDTYAAALAKINEIWELLASVTNVVINTNTYTLIAAVDEPVLRNRDDRKRPVFVCNFNIQYQ